LLSPKLPSAALGQLVGFLKTHSVLALFTVVRFEAPFTSHSDLVYNLEATTFLFLFLSLDPTILDLAK
jgi:hypothetical protein